MSNRSFHMPYYCLLVGLLSMSVGYNILLWHRIELLTIKNDTSWVSSQDIKQIEQEIERLEKESAKLNK